MPDDIKKGQDWIGEMIRQSSSVDVQIHWEEDTERESYYRVTVITPEKQRGSEHIRTAEVEDCAHDENIEVRRRVSQQFQDLLYRLGIAK